jgi:uncharacterized protein (DUF983 family)
MTLRHSENPTSNSSAAQGANLSSDAGASPDSSGKSRFADDRRPTVRSLATLLSRSLRLRCPICGDGKLFRGWFRMHVRCQHCQFRFERSPGYWLGSIFVNYGLTALIITGAYFVLFFSEALTPDWIMRLLLAFCALFPLWFFRYARAIWIGVDLYFDPEPPHAPSSKSVNDQL